MVITIGVMTTLLYGCTGKKNEQLVTDGTLESSAKENNNKPTDFAKVNVESGTLLGYTYKGTYTFKGIPYATAKRFMMPQKVKPWKGIRTALASKEICPNDTTKVSEHEFITPTATDQIANENCQFMNIWTQSLDKNKKKPVVFWIHGGGFSNGSATGLPYYDGNNLSSSGDVVFVSINHRLNSLGFLDLSAYGDKYKYSGNVGMADIVTALQWVQDNIAQFGGDPNNVTITGQSGGGGKVLALMGMPSAKGLFHKAVCQSGFGAPGKDQKTSREEAAKVLEILGITPDKIDDIQKIPYDKLNAAAAKAGLMHTPVVDGDYYPVKTIDNNGVFSNISKDIPFMVTWSFGEFSSNIGTLDQGKLDGYYKPDLKKDEKKVKELIVKKYGDKADAIIEAFKKAYPNNDLCDVLFINSRSDNIALAKADQKGAAVYQAVWNYELPFMGGVVNGHTAGDIPFFFNNVDKINYQVIGKEKETNKFAKQTSTALVNFAYHGNPNYKGMAKWPAFTRKTGMTMILNSKSKAKGYFDRDLMKLITEAGIKPFCPW